jgi:hypothetical protein
MPGKMTRTGPIASARRPDPSRTSSTEMANVAYSTPEDPRPIERAYSAEWAVTEV